MVVRDALALEESSRKQESNVLMCCCLLLKVHLYIFVPLYISKGHVFISNSNNIGNISSLVSVRKHRAEVAFI